MHHPSSYPIRSPPQQGLYRQLHSDNARGQASQISYITQESTIQAFDSHLQQSPVNYQTTAVARPFFKPDDDLLKYSEASSRQVDPVRYASSTVAWQPTYRRVQSISNLMSDGSRHAPDSSGLPRRPHSIDRVSVDLEGSRPTARMPTDSGQIHIVTDPVIFASCGTGSGSQTKAAKYIARIDSPHSNKKQPFDVDLDIIDSNRSVKAFSLLTSGKKVHARVDEDAHRQSVAEAERRIRSELQGQIDETDKNWRDILNNSIIDADSKAVELCRQVLKDASRRFEDEMMRKDREMQKLTEIHHEECTQLQSMLDHWKDQCCRKEHDIHYEKEHHRVLKIENEMAKSDINNLQMRIKDDGHRLEINNSSHKDKIKSLEEEIIHLIALNKDVSERLAKTDKTCDESSQVVMNLRSELDIQSKKSIAYESKIKELSQEKETLLVGLTSQEECMRDIQNEIIQKNNAISDLESMMEQYRHDLKSVEHRTTEMADIYTSDAQGKDRHLNRYAAEIDDLKTSKARLRDENSRLESQLTNKIEELEQIYIDQTDQLSKIEELESKVRSFMREVEMTNTEKDSLKLKVDKLETELTTKQGSNESGLAAMVSQLKSDLIQKQQENADLNEFIYKLESELQETEDTIKSLEHEIREHADYDSKQDNRMYQSNKSDNQEKFRLLEDEIDRVKEVCQELELKNGYLEDRVKRLQSELDRERDVIGKECQRDLIQTTRQLTDARRKLECYENQTEDMSNIVQTKDEELVQLATFCKSLQNELLVLRPSSRNIKRLESDNTRLAEALSQVECDFDEFRHAVEWREHQLIMDKERAENDAKCKKDECEDALYKNGQLIARLSQVYSDIEKNFTSKSTLGQKSLKHHYQTHN